MEDKRTLIGGHLSYRMQGFWAVPLRMWLGLMWLVEGVNKIGEGWLNFSAGTKSGWMFSKGVTQAGVKAAADAATAATGAAGDYAADAATAATGAADAGGPKPSQQPPVLLRTMHPTR